MKRITNKTKIQQALIKHQIANYFSSMNLPFFLAEYEPGEVIISPLNETKYLQFIIKGAISIYSIRGDGSLYEVNSSNEFSLLGDMEFVTGKKPEFWAEAKTEVTTIAFALAEAKEQLMNDITFLHYVMNALAKKVQTASASHAIFSSLDEQLIHYIRYQCTNQTLTHVGDTALKLHCSRRQLQRVLKQLTLDNQIQHIGKGMYQLIPAARPDPNT